MNSNENINSIIKCCFSGRGINIIENLLKAYDYCFGMAHETFL